MFLMLQRGYLVIPFLMVFAQVQIIHFFVVTGVIWKTYCGAGLTRTGKAHRLSIPETPGLSRSNLACGCRPIPDCTLPQCGPPVSGVPFGYKFGAKFAAQSPKTMAKTKKNNDLRVSPGSVFGDKFGATFAAKSVKTIRKN